MEPLKMNPEMNMEVKARLLIKGSGLPLSGSPYMVRLFDRDFFEDDYLGEATPNEWGEIEVRFDYTRMHSGKFEDPLPDFFFVIYQNKEVIFQSKVMQDVDPLRVGHIEMGIGAVVDLGTFLVPLP